MFTILLNDEAGFIVSAELVLIATILVIGLIVGMSEIQNALVAELNDVADAIGGVNQSYSYTGFRSRRSLNTGYKAYTVGSAYFDPVDDCDTNQGNLNCDPPITENPF